MSDFALKEKILKEFKNLGVAPDFKMSQSFYFECLGKLAGHPFDNMVGEELFEKADSDQDGNITPNEFANTFLKADKVIKKKLEESHAKRQDLIYKLDELDAKINELKYQPQEESRIIFFNVVSLENVPNVLSTYFDFATETYSSGDINYQKFQTGEGFWMTLDQMDEMLTIFLNPMANRTTYDSKLDIPLRLIEKEGKTTKSYTLQDLDGFGDQAPVLEVTLMIIKNYLEYYHQKREENELKLEQLQRTIEGDQANHEIIYEPFNRVDYGRASEQPGVIPMSRTSVPMNNQQSHISSNRTFNNNFLNMSPELRKPTLSNNSVRFAPDENVNLRATSNPTELSAYSTGELMKDWHDFVHFLFYCMVAILFLGLVLSFYRAVYVEIMTAAMYCCWYMMKEKFANSISFIYYAAFLVLSFILDFPWLIIYTGGLWEEKYIDGGMQSGLRKITVILSYLIIIPKIAAIVFSGILGLNEPMLVRH